MYLLRENIHCLYIDIPASCYFRYFTCPLLILGSYRCLKLCAYILHLSKENPAQRVDAYICLHEGNYMFVKIKGQILFKWSDP
mgnify:CR=1 FL=1